MLKQEPQGFNSEKFWLRLWLDNPTGRTVQELKLACTYGSKTIQELEKKLLSRGTIDDG